MRGPCIQVCSARTRQRAIHAVVFVGIQVILKICAVPSLLALTLAYAVVRIAASRQPDVHSSSCRTAMAIAVFFGSCVIGNFLWALLGLMLVLAAPRPFLWWPAKPREGDEEMQLVQAVAESRSEAAGESSFEQAVAVGVALAKLRASRGVAAAKACKPQEVQVADPRGVLLSDPVATFSIQALQGAPHGGAAAVLLAAAHPCSGRVRLDEDEALTSPWLVDAAGVSFTPCRTQGRNAACGMHAVFGAPEAGAFAHRSPRSLARTLLGPSLAALREKVPEDALPNLQEVTTSLWAEFLVPFANQRAHGEAGCFGRALERVRPDLLQEMRTVVLAARQHDVAFLRAKDAVQVAARDLFQQDAEDRFTTDYLLGAPTAGMTMFDKSALS